MADFDFSTLPTLNYAPPPQPDNNKGWLGPGLAAGYQEARGSLDAAAAAIGRATGMQGLQQWGEEGAKQRFAAAQQQGNQYYQDNPWSLGGIGYQVAKAIPATVGMIGAGALVGASLPADAAAVTGTGILGSLARFGTQVPKFLGGGAGLTGDAAAAAGGRWASSLVGATAAGYPLAAGGMYQTAVNSGQDTQGNAIKALALGVPAAALGGIMPGQLRDIAAAGVGENAAARLMTRVMQNVPVPTQLRDLAAKGISGDMVTRLLSGAMEAGPTNMMQAGVQTALNQQFEDPNRTLPDKMHDIVQSALQGGVVGGVLGGGLSALRGHPATPTAPEAPPATPYPELSGRPGPQGVLPGILTPDQFPPHPASEWNPLVQPGTDANRQIELPGILRPVESPYQFGPPLEAGTEVGGQGTMFPVASMPPSDARSTVHPIDQQNQFQLFPEANPNTAQYAPTAPVAPEAAQTVARIMDQAHAGAMTEGMQRIADARGVTDLLTKPYDQLTPDQKALYDSAYPLTRRGQQDVLTAQVPPDAAARVVDQLRAGTASERVKQIADKFQLHDLANKPYDQLTDTQKALYDQMQPLTQEGAKNAVQEQSAAPLDVREQAGPSEGVRGGNAEGSNVAGADQTSEAAKAPQEAQSQGPVIADFGQTPAERAWLKNNVKGDALSSQDAVSVAVIDRLRAGNAGKSVMAIADRMGLTDLVDKPVEQLTPEQQTMLDRLQPFTKDGQLAVTEAPKRVAFGRRGQVSLPQATGNQREDVTNIINAGGSAKHVLDYFSRSASTPAMREYAGFLRNLGIGSKTSFGVPTEFGPDAVAGYKMRGDTIHLDPTSTDLQTDFLHEATHAATMSRLQQDTQPARQMQKLYDQVSKNPNFDGSVYSERNQPYGLRDVHEFTAEAFSNPRFQEFLRNQSPTLWQSFKNGVFKLLGMPSRARSVFDQVMDSGRQLMEQNRNLPLTDGRPAPTGMASRVGSVPDAVDMAPRMMDFVDNAKGYLQKQLDDARDNPISFWQAVRKGGLGWADSQELRLRADHMFSGAIHTWEQSRELGRVATDRIMQMQTPVRAAAVDLARTNQQANRTWNYLRYSSQIHGYDYRKWSGEQPENFEGMPPEQAQQKRALVDDAKRKWDSIAGVATKADDLQRGAGQAANFIRHNLLLDDQYRKFYSDRNLPAFQLDPIMEIAQHADMLKDPSAVAAFARQTLKDRTDQLESLGASRAPDIEALGAREQEIQQRIDALKASNADKDAIKAATDEKTKTHEEVQSMQKYQRDITKIVDGTRRAVAEADKVPFSHYGRDGDHFVSMKLKANPDGTIDAKAFARMQQLVNDAGFTNLVMDSTNANNHLFARVADPTTRERLLNVGKQLQKEGHLEFPGKDPETGVTVDHPLSAGPIDRIEASTFRGNAPAAVERLLSALQADHADLPPEVARDLMDKLNGVYLDMLPKNSMVRLFEPRMGTQGFNEDMSSSFDQYMTQFANSAGRMWSQPRIMDALSSMAKTVNDYKHNPDAPSGSVDVANAVAQEIMKRETSAPVRAKWGWMRNWLALNHSYFLGLSPAYTVELMTQIPTLLLPELGRKYGYLDSSKAIGSAFMPSLKVVRALISSGHGVDGILTPEALQKAGLSKTDADFIMKVALRGKLELGGWTKSTLGDAPSIARMRMAQYGNMLNVASEVLPRAMAAFAARDLHVRDSGAKARMELHDYVDQTIGQSMYNWQTDLQARNLGAGGFAGPITPLVTKFMSFQSKMLGRLIREADQSFGGLSREMAEADIAKGAKGSVEQLTKQYRDESRRFLAGHLAAVTVLAGSLGLPVLPVAASAASSVANFLTGSDKFDAETWYRNHLNDVFGPEVGEVIAKGLPRALGADLSEHAGEDRLIPFSDMLTDKRKWTDMFDSAAFHAMGSPFSMASNMVRGATDLANGRVLKGAQELLPSSAKNPFRAWRLSQFGYEDDNGHKLAGLGEPSAADIAMQAIGIPPTAKARYDEATEALHDLQSRRQIVTSNLEANLNTAFAHHDNDAFQQAMGQIMNFNQDHPTSMMNPSEVLSHSLRQQMMGQSFGANNFNPRNLQQWDILRAHGMLPAQR